MSRSDTSEYWDDFRKHQQTYEKSKENWRQPRTHKMSKQHGKSICGLTFEDRRIQERLRIKWGKVTCKECLKQKI